MRFSPFLTFFSIIQSLTVTKYCIFNSFENLSHIRPDIQNFFIILLMYLLKARSITEHCCQKSRVKLSIVFVLAYFQIILSIFSKNTN
jgi:hypothetical protein